MNRRIDCHPLGKGEEAIIDLLAFACRPLLGKERALREAQQWKESIILGRIISSLDHHKTLFYYGVQDLVYPSNPDKERDISIHATSFEIANFVVITPDGYVPEEDGEPWHLGRVTATEVEIYNATIYGPVRVRMELEKTEFFGFSARTGKQIAILETGIGHTDDIGNEFNDLPIIPDLPRARDIIARAGGANGAD